MTTKKETILIFSLILIFGGIFIIASLSFDNGYKTGYQKATENLIQRLDKCEEDNEFYQKDISEWKEDKELGNKFVEERCVCVSWGNSIEEPLTKDEICNYQCPKDGVCPLFYPANKDLLK